MKNHEVGEICYVCGVFNRRKQRPTTRIECNKKGTGKILKESTDGQVEGEGEAGEGRGAYSFLLI